MKYRYYHLATCLTFIFVIVGEIFKNKRPFNLHNGFFQMNKLNNNKKKQ